MTLDTFSSGVNTSFSTELNNNFTELQAYSDYLSGMNSLLNNNFDGFATYSAKAAGPRGFMNFPVVDTSAAETVTGFQATTSGSVTYAKSFLDGLSGTCTIESMGIPIASATTKAFVHWDYVIYDAIDDSGFDADPAGTDTDDTNDLTSYKHIWFRWTINSNVSSAPNVQFSDGTNTSNNLISFSPLHNGDSTIHGITHVYIDWTNKKSHASTYWNYEDTDNGIGGGQYRQSRYVSLSSLTGTSLYLRANVSSASHQFTVTQIRAEAESPTTDVTISMSADGGSNYTESDNGYITGLTSGSSLKTKIEAVIGSGEGVEVYNYTMKPL